MEHCVGTSECAERSSDVRGPPALLVAAVIRDLEDATLVEVQTTTLTFQTLKQQGIS